MKGIILAGGLGSRLSPITTSISKQLLPIYNKPMIYYPMTLLINSGIKDICIISSIEYINLYKKLFATGRELGVKVRYLIQRKPKGIAESLIIAKNFIKNSPSAKFFVADPQNKLSSFFSTVNLVKQSSLSKISKENNIDLKNIKSDLYKCLDTKDTETLQNITMRQLKDKISECYNTDRKSRTFNRAYNSNKQEILQCVRAKLYPDLV